MRWRVSKFLSNSDLSEDGTSRISWTSLSSSLLRLRDLGAWDGLVSNPLPSASLFPPSSDGVRGTEHREEVIEESSCSCTCQASFIEDSL